MNKLNLLVVAVLSSITVGAAFADATIDSVMLDMNTAVKTITKNVSDATQNTASATLCDQVIADITTAQTFTPASVAKLSADQQAAAEQQYITLLGQLKDQFTTLKADFVAGDNASATTELAAINSTKVSGHQQFAQ